MKIIEGRAEIDDVGEFVERVSAIATEHDVTIQTFDARSVVDRAHLRRAVDIACREISRNEQIAEDRGVEILLYAAGRRQINRALEMGVSSGNCPVVAVVVDCETHDWEGDEVSVKAAETAAAAEIEGLLDTESVLGEYDAEHVRSFYDITETELAATDGGISDLVRERVALLVVER